MCPFLGLFPSCRGSALNWTFRFATKFQAVFAERHAVRHTIPDYSGKNQVCVRRQTAAEERKRFDIRMSSFMYSLINICRGNSAHQSTCNFAPPVPFFHQYLRTVMVIRKTGRISSCVHPRRFLKLCLRLVPTRSARAHSLYYATLPSRQRSDFASRARSHRCHQRRLWRCAS